MIGASFRSGTGRNSAFWSGAVAEKSGFLEFAGGMQVMALFAGGKLKKVPGHCGRRHGLAGSRAVVNSFHRWAVPECPPGFRVIHRARDGIIEQIRHGKLPWTGIMWHPERPGNRGDRSKL